MTPALDGIRHRWPIGVSILAALASAAVAGRFLPYAEPFHYYLAAAREFLATGRITDFHSVGYSLLIAASLRMGGLNGVVALHGVIVASTAAAAVILMRRVDNRPWVGAVAGLSVALNPILVANVTKISDNNLTTLLLLLVVIALVRAHDHALAPRSTISLALLFAAVLLVRPNMSLLFLPIVWFSRRQVAAVLAAVAITMAVNAWATGHWRISDPFYAAYAFNNGNNPHALETVRDGVSAESTTAETLEDAGIDQRMLTNEQARQLFWRTAFAFIRDHPADYITLRAAKLAAFFTPYFRSGRTGLMKIAADAGAIVMSLPVVVWISLRVWRRRAWTWSSGFMAAIVLPLYVLPFFLINAEARYRWPVDVVLILESIALVALPRISAPAPA